MKTKTLKIITLVMSVVLVMSMLTGCAKSYKIYENDFFQYIIMGETSRYPKNKKAAVIAIVGFTWLGEQQEVIEIPREIAGIPVRYIGYDDQVCHDRYEVYSENLKKIYVHDNIEKIGFFQGKDVDMMLCSINDNFRIHTSFTYFKKKYIYKSMMDKTNIKVSPANIVFMNNYSDEINEGYYRLDNIEYGETIPMPPEPVRSGFEFTGWYTETECINLWDFDMSPTIEEDTEFRLYAGWREK